ncbi:HEPN domain-containing protein [Paenibacillus macquariensis]|uniref:HEPN domain-containing protein n=1 Tax=Paenibacillus macquariensis TaxID=948756 RepID=A0ABY1JX29_9BACL|nr:HEPN domain-containing protein [Paenibacillus macquariensis]MEC0089395.1 HEPN domain-containing protein [Paenibacillus macquariensis]OAB33217.1 hypothetical protein PMSM_14460 [Paenibacillus macquariensis subsp. macquariensis]SIQ92208.1 HEPN domain-containing protein [Paenibacillus macquariensis]
MATAQQHKRQFEKNKATIAVVNQLDSPPNDWLITMAFYAAVHLIEGVIVDKTSKGTKDHKTRRVAMTRISTLRPVGALYSTLEDYSHRSRYQCKSFNKEDVSKILEFLDRIEKQLA